MRQSEINDPLEYEYSQTFFIAGLTAVIQKWLDNCCQESEEKLLNLLTRQLLFSQQMLSHLDPEKSNSL